MLLHHLTGKQWKAMALKLHTCSQHEAPTILTQETRLARRYACKTLGILSSSDLCTKGMFRAWVFMQNACEGGSALVGVCMMNVVLDPPGLKGVYEGGKHEGAHNVLHQLVFAEGTVPAVMTHHKKLHTHNNPYWCRQSVALAYMCCSPGCFLPARKAMFYCPTGSARV